VIELVPVAELDVSAASGLAALPDAICVIADDETFLAVYGYDGLPRARVPLLPDRLPEEHHARKRSKPDFEALAVLPGGRLLALGSGSTAERRRGVLITTEPTWAVRTLDLAPLYDALARELPELNVEGAAMLGDRLVLLQRGNGAARDNARIDLDLPTLLHAIDRGDSELGAAALRTIERVQLGEIAGVPLGFTDAAAHPTAGLLFTAAAEDTADTYLDGRCAGSVVGVLSGGTVRSAHVVEPACKLEGLACRSEGGAATRLWLVADADDRHVSATLFSAVVAL
jgi:hypothetical protein